MPGTVLGTGNTVMNKHTKFPVHILHLSDLMYQAKVELSSLSQILLICTFTKEGAQLCKKELSHLLE